MIKDKDIYLLILNGSSSIDFQIKIVDKLLWDWINSPYDDNLGISYQETIPKEIVKKIGINFCKVNLDQYMDDRASLVSDLIFSSLKDAFKHIKDNNLNVVDEYHGYHDIINFN